MAELEITPEELESIARLQELPHWERLRGVAQRKLARIEGSISRLVFRTRSEVDPLEVEYFRGFRQGVMYVLDGLPNDAVVRLKKLEAEDDKEVD